MRATWKCKEGPAKILLLSDCSSLRLWSNDQMVELNSRASLHCAPYALAFSNRSLASLESCQKPFHHNSVSWRALMIDSLASELRRGIPVMMRLM
jgi:hypothetical protein